MQRLCGPLHGNVEVATIEFYPDEIEPQPGAGDRRRAEPGERIEDLAGAVRAVEPQAVLRQPHRESYGFC